MRIKKRHIVVFTAALIFFLRSPAQEFNDDARLWLYVKLDKDLGKKVNAHLLFQNRFNNNVGEASFT